VAESLGARLRRARADKGWTIEQLASITKLNPQFIEALESGRWDLLPGRVYLKSFAKVCAEALDIDVKEVYEKIDGAVEEKKFVAPVSPPPTPAEKRLDYKLPVVLGIGVVVVILIFLAVRSNRTETSNGEGETIIPARGLFRRAEIKWDRPWERPPADSAFYRSNRLTLETDEDDVKAMIVADNDTVFKGEIPEQSSKVFTAASFFRLTLSRNDRARVYLNGTNLEIGKGSRSLNNELIDTSTSAAFKKLTSKDTTQNEAE
jgi:cytoskeletal protein RodZ